MAVPDLVKATIGCTLLVLIATVTPSEAAAHAGLQPELRLDDSGNVHLSSPARLYFETAHGSIDADKLIKYETNISDLRTDFQGRIDILTGKINDDVMPKVDKAISDLTNVTDALQDLETRMDKIDDMMEDVNGQFAAVNQTTDGLANEIGDGLQRITDLETAMDAFKAWQEDVNGQLKAGERTRPKYPKSCQEWNLTVAEAGVRTIYPKGDNSKKIEVYCAVLANPLNGEVGHSADWTIIASQADGADRSNNFKDTYGNTPTPSKNGAVEYFMTTDLRDIATEMFVNNDHGEGHVFSTSEFTGPLVFDGDNFCAAATTVHQGIIAGNKYPIVFHYQVESKCDSADCYEKIDVLNDNGAELLYSQGMMILFDFKPEQLNRATRTYTAAFGGSAHLYSHWSWPGNLIAIR